MLRVLGIVLFVLVVGFAILWAWLRGPDIPYATLEAKYANGDSHFVDVEGVATPGVATPGAHVHYRDEGNAAGPTLLLLHGFGDSHTSWEGWVRELKPDYRLISLDFPGHGLTRAPETTPLTGASLADFVAAFAAALQLPPFAVAGNSMGGGVAWQLALRHPELVSALILVDAAGFANAAPSGPLPLAFKILQYPIGRALLRNIDNRPLISESLKVDVYDKSLITAALVDRWAEFQRAPGHRTILMSLNPAALGGADAVSLSAIKVPTLILWGAGDPLLEPASAGKFAAAIPQAKVITYPQVGHLPQIEIPARSATDVARFLAVSLPDAKRLSGQ